MRYDDSESLQIKYDIAVEMDLLGVGMWTANGVDYADNAQAKNQRQKMWGVIPFTKPNTVN